MRLWATKPTRILCLQAWLILSNGQYCYFGSWQSSDKQAQQSTPTVITHANLNVNHNPLCSQNDCIAVVASFEEVSKTGRVKQKCWHKDSSAHENAWKVGADAASWRRADNWKASCHSYHNHVLRARKRLTKQSYKYNLVDTLEFLFSACTCTCGWVRMEVWRCFRFGEKNSILCLQPKD